MVSEQQISFGVSLILTDYLRGSIHVYLFGLLMHKYQEVPTFCHFQGGIYLCFLRIHRRVRDLVDILIFPNLCRVMILKCNGRNMGSLGMQGGQLVCGVHVHYLSTNLHSFSKDRSDFIMESCMSFLIAFLEFLLGLSFSVACAGPASC